MLKEQPKKNIDKIFKTIRRIEGKKYGWKTRERKISGLLALQLLKS
jgi:hypothetical protein